MRLNIQTILRKTTKAVLITAVFASASLTAQVDRSQQPEPNGSPVIKLEEPQTFELKNGLKVLVVENHKLPRVSVQLLLDNPPILEGEKAGVSSLTGSLLGKGSVNISKDDFNDEVDFLGASINFSGQSAFASTLSRNFPRIIELMADAAINPNFSGEEFDKEKERYIENLKSDEKNVSAVARRVESALAYGTTHPNGEFSSIESIEKVTLEDTKAFYEDFFVPENAYLVLIGDLTLKEAKKLVKSNFGKWKAKSTKVTPFTEASNPEITEINFVDMPNAVQSEIIVQNLVDLKMSDEDYIPALIANQILGGGAEGRLFLNLREDKGYTYGSYSGIGSSKDTKARFRATAQVRNAVTDSAVVQILEEVKRIRIELVNQEDLKNAKEKYKGSFVRSLERPQTVANFALNIETQGLDGDFYETYLSRIDAVTAEEVMAAANKFFALNNLRIVVVGKGVEVAEALENINFDGAKLKVNYFDPFANSIEKPTFSKPLPAGLTAQKVIANYLDKVGGTEAIQSVNSYVIKATATIQGMTLELATSAKGANYTQEMKMMGNVMQRSVLTESEAYQEMQGQRIPMSEEDRQKMQLETGIVAEIAWVDNPEIKLTAIESVNGSDAYVVQLTKDRALYFDVNTGLKIQEIVTVEAGGQTITQKASFSNYKEVNGILIPHSVSRNLGPQTLDFQITEITIN
ncbi:MAG: insulinase family protein [Flavobacteriaceae bacterium]|jgi:predicted Zn-dependent peptidase|nr:insulinase family protein [Flavobacteriaceae bacterium]